jgi:hypothetical protein
MEKEESKLKLWIKKHKTGLLVGATAVAGVGISLAMYKMGYTTGGRNGFKDGYNEGIDFCNGEWELLQSSTGE